MLLVTSPRRLAIFLLILLHGFPLGATGEDKDAVISIPLTQPPEDSSRWFEKMDWSTATRLGPLLKIGQQAASAASANHTVRLLQDQEWLYLAYELDLPDAYPWKNEGNGRDQAVYKGDSVECHLQGTDGRRLQIIVNQAGIIYDARDGDPEWNARVESASIREGKKHRIYLRWDKRDFLNEGPPIGMNFGVVLWRAGHAECYTVVPLRNSFLEKEPLIRVDFTRKTKTEMSYALRTFTDSETTLEGQASSYRFPDQGFSLEETAYLSGRHLLAAQEKREGRLLRKLPTGRSTGKNSILRLTWKGNSPVGMTAQVLDENGKALASLPLLTLKKGEREQADYQWKLPDNLPDNALLELSFTRLHRGFAILQLALESEGGDLEERVLEETYASWRKPGRASIEWGEDDSMLSPTLTEKKVLFIIPSGDLEIERLSRRYHLRPTIVFDRQGTLYRRSSTEPTLARNIDGGLIEHGVIIASEPHDALRKAVERMIRAEIPLLIITSHPDLWQKMLKEPRERPLPLTDVTKRYANLFPLKAFPPISRIGNATMISSIHTFGHSRPEVTLVGLNGRAPLRALLPPVEPAPAGYAGWQNDYYSFLAHLIRVNAEPLPALSIAHDSERRTLLLQGASPNSTLNLHFYAAPETSISTSSPLLMEKRTLNIGTEATTTIPWPPALSEFVGKRIARIEIFDKQGKLVNWGSWVSSSKEAVPLRTRLSESDDRTTIAVTIAKKESLAPLQLEVTSRDINRRLLDHQQVPIQASPSGETALTLKPNMQRSTTPGVIAALSLWNEDRTRLLALREELLHSSYGSKPIMSDFHLGIHGDFFLRTETDQDYVKWFKKLGFESIMEGSHFSPSRELNMPWIHSGIAREIFTDHASGNHQRRHSLNDPKVIELASRNALEGYEKARASEPMFTVFGDELELARDGAYEVDYSEGSIAAFREWLKERYPSLEALNKAWQRSYHQWEEIIPLREDEARAKGEIALWVHFRRFMEEVWYNAFREVRNTIQRKHPTAKLGLTNPFYLNPFSGENHYRSANEEDVLAKYFRPDLIKQYRSFGKGKSMQTWFGYYEAPDVCRFYPLWFAFHGGESVHFWNGVRSYSNYDLLDASGRETERSNAFLSSGKLLTDGAAAVLASFHPKPAPIGILHSQESMRVAYFKSSMKAKSAPWARHGLGKEPITNFFGEWTRSTFQWIEMVKECQLQPEFVDLDHWKRQDERVPPILCAPFLISVSDAQLQSITEWVREGGTLICDLAFATHDENGLPRDPSNSLLSLLGLMELSTQPNIERAPVYSTGPQKVKLGYGRLHHSLTVGEGNALAMIGDEVPAWIEHSVEKGKVLFLNFIPEITPPMIAHFREALGEHAKGNTQALDAEGNMLTGYEVFPFAHGNSRLFGILRDLEPLSEGAQSAWFPGPLYRKAVTPKESARIVFERPGHLYDVFKGEYLGWKEEVTLSFPSGSGHLLAVLDEAIGELSVAAEREQYVAGETLLFEVGIGRSGGTPSAPCLIIMEVYGPDGAPLSAYRRKILVNEKTATISLPTALDEKEGRYRVTFREVMSGKTAQASYLISPAPTAP